MRHSFKYLAGHRLWPKHYSETIPSSYKKEIGNTTTVNVPNKVELEMNLVQPHPDVLQVLLTEY